MAKDISRRDFVGITAAAATAWAAMGDSAHLRQGDGGQALAAQERAQTRPGARGRLNLGVASYSMRELSLDQALEGAKTLGVTSMTFKDVHLPRTDPPEVTRALSAKIKAAGIQIAGGGTITLPNDPAQILREPGFERRDVFEALVVDALRREVAVGIDQRLDFDVGQPREATLERVPLAANADARQHDAVVGALDAACAERSRSIADERRRVEAAANNHARGGGAHAGIEVAPRNTLCHADLLRSRRPSHLRQGSGGQTAFGKV